VYDKNRRYLGLVNTDRVVSRPSGIFYYGGVVGIEDPAIFVLNLNDNSMAKYNLLRTDE